jgi:hypothetical protein
MLASSEEMRRPKSLPTAMVDLGPPVKDASRRQEEED